VDGIHGVDLLPAMINVKYPGSGDFDVVPDRGDRQPGGRAGGCGERIRWVGCQRAVRSDLGEQGRVALKLVSGAEEIFKSRIHLDPDVMVAIRFALNVQDEASGALAWVEHMQPVGTPHSGFRRTGTARSRSRRILPCGLWSAAHTSGQHRDDQEPAQRMYRGTHLNRDSAKGPGPDAITWALTSTPR
jgi:hypothetical protein